MSPERWSQIEELYHAAADRDPGTRAAFLESACGPDTELRDEVESLLLREAKAANFLESIPRNNLESNVLPAQVGPYRVSSLLGTGGMGVVYRAHDDKLDRDVALKTLPREFAALPDRLTRLRREARTLAALNHPNIAAIHGLEESDGVTFLVLELVEGDTLRSPLPIEQTIEYARQFAEALEAAHTKGIIHRDLKPGNIKITPQGRVKVLDFGLAKAVWGTDENLKPVVTPPSTILQTAAGQITGTPPYMSPEQARGQIVDHRTDIWAFGCILYELLSGKRAFSGETMAETIDAVLERDPDFAALPTKTPAKVRELIRRCLEKNVARRLQNIAAARVVLEQAQRSRSRWPVLAAITLAVALLAGSVVVGLRLAGSRAGGAQVKPLTSYPGAELFPAVSPDGKAVAFVWTGLNGNQADLYARPVEGEPPLRLTSDPAMECYPTWSPDGALIAFLHCDGNMGGIRTEADVYVVGSSGGPKRKLGTVLLQAYDNVPALAWMPDGKHLVVRNRINPQDPIGLFSRDIETGQMRRLTSPPATYDDAAPAVSQDGRTLAFVRQTTTRHGDIFLQDLSTGKPDPKQITHEQLRVLGIAWQSPRELISLTEDGTSRTFYRVRTDGSARQPLDEPGQPGLQFSVSRDGRRLVYSDAYIDADIARVSLAQASVGTPLRAETFIASTKWDGAPQYSPDGRRIAFGSVRSGQFEIWMADADGTNPRQLTAWNRYTGTPRWSPSGDEIAADSQEGKHTDIYVIGVSNGQTHMVTAGVGQNVIPSWSRDGKWIYFVSDRHDGFQVWKALAHTGDRSERAIQVTKHGGFAGWESLDGKRFYYAKSNGPTCIWTVPADGGVETEVTCPLNSWHYIAMFPDGIYFAPRTSTQIWFLRFADRQARHVFDLQGGAGGGFAFSPDRKWLLTISSDLRRGDLYLVDLALL